MTRKSGTKPPVCSTPEQLVCIAFERDVLSLKALREKGVEFMPDGRVKGWPTDGRYVYAAGERLSIEEAEDIGRSLATEFPRFLEMYVVGIDIGAAMEALGLEWQEE